MTTFGQFSQRCKMRHDFGDQIQVRYRHVDGEQYDTWVSGSEALGRLESSAAEEQLAALGRLSADDLRRVVAALPEAVQKKARHTLRDRLADTLESSIGDNPIGEALSDAVRGHESSAQSTISEKDNWQALLRYEPFRQKVLELAWIALEGSFPGADSEPEPDDWI